MPSVFTGVFFHWLGGLASGSFYVPYKAVKRWSWEVYWLAGGIVSWLLAPWILAFCLTEKLLPSLAEAFSTAPQAMGYAYLFGCLWGIGGLTFGLTMRYLGMSLGMAIALGYCTVLGTVMPPIVDGSFVPSMKTDPAFVVTILGLGVCMLGVILAAIAGTSKEREMDAEAKKATIQEFSFVKGLIVATISGVFSACMAYGLQAAEPLAEISKANGTGDLWVGLPKLCVVLLGGLTSNAIWCGILLAKNKTAYQFTNPNVKNPNAGQEGEPETHRVCMTWNYFFAGLAGLTWYLQFFFYSMGETKMGEFKFSSWTLHMASIIIFSSLWGLALREWKGTSKFTKFVLGFAIFTLLYSTIVVGYGNLMKTAPTSVAATALNDAVKAVADVESVPAKKLNEKLATAAYERAVGKAYGAAQAAVGALADAADAKATAQAAQTANATPANRELVADFAAVRSTVPATLEKATEALEKAKANVDVAAKLATLAAVRDALNATTDASSAADYANVAKLFDGEQKAETGENGEAETPVATEALEAKTPEVSAE